MTDEQRQELYQAINYDEKAAVIESVDFPKEVNFGSSFGFIIIVFFNSLEGN